MEITIFDIYVQKRDQEGDKMNWIIKDSGPCKIKDGSIDCFQWNPNVVAGEIEHGHTHNL
jgi:hypothetical protein